MTKSSTSCNAEAGMIANSPFLLAAVGKDYLWGGNRLQTDFAKKIDMSPLAETWECSTHPDGPSLVRSGVFAGKLLTDVLKEHPEFLGSHPLTKDELPILIKLIDAKQDLSVQVHPDDGYARVHENGSWGKSEMWYVLDADKDTELVYGFNHDITEEKLRKSLENGTVEKYLQKIPVQKDDVFFVDAGTVHAIGAGALIAEIQQNSNLTYRMYDYNRRDKSGKERELHIDKALAVANLKNSSEPRQPLRVLRYRRGCASELLCRCRYFQVERMLLNTGLSVACQTGSNSFQVLLCVEGTCQMNWRESALGGVPDEREVVNTGGVPAEEKSGLIMQKGDCVFIPANSVPLQLSGTAQLLCVGC